jgi:6-phosphogluconolactonase (cycloisomerase 2 family)
MSHAHRPRLRLFLGATFLVLAVSPSVASAQGRVDLRDGAVFSATNNARANAIVAFDRGSDGRLRRVASYRTGGKGSGSFEDSANGVILASPAGESSPNNLPGGRKFVIATNSGSRNITVFRILRDRLQRVELRDSRGEKPVSVTVNRGLLYVLNSGEVENALNPPNCTTGFLPTVSGFRLAESGRLTPIANSTRQLSGTQASGCAQVSFDPSGRTLVATERGARTSTQADGDEGLITTWAVRDNGTLANKRVIDAAGQGPFGFTFTRNGTLLTTEQFDGPSGPGRGALTSYRLGADGTLETRSASVANGGTDTCWVIANDAGTRAWAVSFFGGGRISSYDISPDGTVKLRRADATNGAADQGAGDVALSRDGRFLYNVNAASGLLSAYRTTQDGRLRQLQRIRVAPASTMEPTLGLAGS